MFKFDASEARTIKNLKPSGVSALHLREKILKTGYLLDRDEAQSKLAW